MSGYRSWNGPPRVLAVAVDAAVGAADAADTEAFGEALADLHRTDREQLQVLLGTATATLLERAAPDGLDAEEAERIVRGCFAAAAAWYPAIDADALLAAFTASVGVTEADADPEAPPPPGPDAVLAHGLLLVAYLRTATRSALDEVLEHALRELHRAQTMELP